MKYCTQMANKRLLRTNEPHYTFTEPTNCKKNILTIQYRVSVSSVYEAGEAVDVALQAGRVAEHPVEP